MTLEIGSRHQQLPPSFLNPQPPPVHRLPSTCDRHPDIHVTGFCASCLRERLAGLETPSARRNSTSSASSSLKSIFFKTANGLAHPELRRSKSFSCGRADAFSGPRAAAAFEPQRKSCDVRGRNTLWSLFNQADHDRLDARAAASSTTVAAADPVIESPDDEEASDEIRAVDPVLVVGTSGEIEGEKEEDKDADLKPMKDHIDLDLESQTKKPPPRDFKEIAGSFWLAASVFSKKLQKWRRKQKRKKVKKQPDKSDPKSSRRFRETQSEVAVDAFGRRSCDTDPRFSLDAGRISFDDPRFSWDEPRASWDGHLIGGGRSLFPRIPPMLAVVEDVPTPAAVQRSDGQIPVEEDPTTPGGSAQTRDYYSDSSSRSRRWSLDRSNSVRKSSVEVNDLKPVSNAKVSPAVSTEFFRDWSSNSLRDDHSGSFESTYRDSHQLPPRKKSKRWSKAWNIWGFIHRRSSKTNVVERSLSESWPELRTNGYNGRILRSNSSVSSRSYLHGNAGFGSLRRNGNVETNGQGKKRREEFVLERNRSARYSPSNLDNGMLRFYLTPMRGSRRSGGLAKNRHNSSYHSFTRSMLRLY